MEQSDEGCICAPAHQRPDRTPASPTPRVARRRWQAARRSGAVCQTWNRALIGRIAETLETAFRSAQISEQYRITPRPPSRSSVRGPFPRSPRADRSTV